jgi:sugar-specific transcriptional regulator TrmB
MKQESIKDALLTLGLSTEESQTYLLLAGCNSASAQELAKKMKRPRSSVYNFLNGLLQRNLIITELTPKGALYRALPPKTWRHVLEKDREDLANRARIIEQIIPKLEHLKKGTPQSTPHIQTVKGKRNVENMLYYLCPEWRKSYVRRNDFVMWGYQDHTFVEEYSKWHEHAWTTRNENEEIRLFSTPQGVAQQNREKIQKREIRLLPEGMEFPCSVWIHGDFIILAYTRTHEHHGVAICDHFSADMLRGVFRYLWWETGRKQ